MHIVQLSVVVGNVSRRKLNAEFLSKKGRCNDSFTIWVGVPSFFVECERRVGNELAEPSRKSLIYMIDSIYDKSEQGRVDWLARVSA